jgi:hypothetical protein
MTKVLFETNLVQANQNGVYVGFGKNYKIKISSKDILLNNNSIPLEKIVEVEKIGKGVSLIFLDQINVKKQLFFTKDTVFGIGRNKHLDIFTRELKLALENAKKSASVSKTEIQEAPTYICHECGSRDGINLEFGLILSLLVVVHRHLTIGVYCPKHATIIGLPKLILTSLFGWWSPSGLFITPKYIIRNIKSLAKHSSLPSGLVYILGVISFAPLLAGILFFISVKRLDW